MNRSILGLIYLIQGMRNTGINVDQRLAQIGIQVEALNPHSVIHRDLDFSIQNIISQDIETTRGLDIGQHYSLVGYGSLLMLLLTSQTIQNAIEQCIKYQKLTHLFGQLTMKKTANTVHLIYSPTDLKTGQGILRAQCEISGTYRFILDIYKMMGLEIPQIRVDLPFEPPKNLTTLAKYQYYYGDNLHFNAEQAIFSLDTLVLDIKIPSADMIKHRIYEAKCLEEIEHLNSQPMHDSDLVQRVTNYLELQKGVIPSMAQTAMVLNIPERTLRHQLQQCNTSYKQIREQLIKNKALKLMEYKEYSIECIAELLGYSEPAAFNHAFKRWFGQSPRRYGK